MRRPILAAVIGVVTATALTLGVPAGGAPHVSRPGSSLRSRTAGIADRPASRVVSGSAHDRATVLHDPAWPASRAVRDVASPLATRSVARTPTIDPTIDFDSLGQPLVSPGDPTGALGPAAIVAAVNVRAAVYDRTGNQLVPPQRLKALANRPGAVDTDPKVFYDPYDDTYVLVFLVFNDVTGWIEVVTIPGPTATDMHTWCRTEIPGDQIAGDGKQFADYPTVGFTEQRVTIATNNFAFDLAGYDYAQIISMRKSQLYDDPTCSKTVHLDVLGGTQTRDPDGSKAFTIQPVMSIGGSPSTQYLMSVDAEQRSTALVLWRLRFRRGRTFLRKVAIPVARAQLPPLGYQCGSTNRPTTWWDTGDLRLMNAWYDADRNRIYASHAVEGNPGGGVPESVIRWYEVRPAPTLGSSRVTRTGTIATPGHDAAWSSVATTADGRLWVTYARAGLDECLSSWVANVPRGSTVATKVSVHEGEARYEFSAASPTEYGIERWGDYSATNRDPLDPNAIGSFNAYAKSDGGGATSLFMQRVTRLTDV
jgi:hypothetical protein